mmetsp:Transcript_2584/g.5875  ORF Transcript_2584/g.5875 Transcript_2584/m.5875 type:complete len:285 (-) Transcript_2584:645-1499(-)
MDFSESSLASSMTMRASPMSTLRTTLHFWMSKASVMAIVDLHTYTGWLPWEAKVAPARSRMVTQPALPSKQDLHFRCTSELVSSGLGPSSSSSTSSWKSSLTTADLSSKFLCRLALRAAHKNGFSLGLRKGAPVLPLSVTQPLAPSRRARPLTRMTCESLSSTGPSRTSKSSPCSSFLTVEAVAIFRSLVMMDSFSHLTYSCRILAKAGLRSPCFPNSLYTRETSSLLRPTCKPSTNLENWAADISPLPDEADLKISSTLCPNFRAAALRDSRACFVAVFTTER